MGRRGRPGEIGPGRPGWFPTQVPGKEVTFPSPSPPRTARESFPSCSSRLHKRPSRDAAAFVSRSPGTETRGRRTCIATPKTRPLSSITNHGPDTASSDRPIPAAAPFAHCGTCTSALSALFRPLVAVARPLPEAGQLGMHRGQLTDHLIVKLLEPRKTGGAFPGCFAVTDLVFGCFAVTDWLLHGD